MNKIPANKSPMRDESLFCKSKFTLTFVLEILGIDVWTDCNLGWQDLGIYLQAMKVQYQLFPGRTYDLDILIWPHVAKVWSGNQYAWVRAWQFLERRWLTVSINHAFPVRVLEFRNFVATVTVTLGTGSLSANAKNDRNFTVCIPPLQFGERRYFAAVLEEEESLEKYLGALLWSLVEQHIPASYLDGMFDVPFAVTDVRHQDAALQHVQDIIFERKIPEEEEPEEIEEVKSMKDRRASKVSKEKVKKAEPIKLKFEIKLSGHSIIAGTGRIVRFETVGDHPPDLGEIIVLISSHNLPAQDDMPVIFVNVDKLCDIPLKEFKALRITQLYTRWIIGDEEHNSLPQLIKSKKDIYFNDHYAIPLPYEVVKKVMASFNDNYYEVQLRGIRLLPQFQTPVLFGYQKGDRDYDQSIPKQENTDADFLIAITKIHTKRLAKKINALVRGEYSLYPPMTSVKVLDREGVCTNDINGIRSPVVPDLIVKPDVVLLAQMTLEVSIGLVGCKSLHYTPCYSRMFCMTKDSEAILSILRHITTINEDLLQTEKRDDALTGFAIDTGEIAFMFVEGPKDGYILHVWDMTEDFYPKMKPLFSCTEKYATRIYPELLLAATPFTVLKMFVPIGVLLACPPVYARPAIPLPTRSAMLKIGRLLYSKLKFAPSRCEMPTGAELKSLRLELCVAPRPIPVSINDNIVRKIEHDDHPPLPQSASRINWDK